MRFESWYYLLILLLIPVFHRYWMKTNRRPGILFSPKLPRTIQKSSPIRKRLFLRYLAFIFLVFALARPQESFERKSRVVSGIDIMMVMDVSMSMNIEDLSAVSRLEVAKNTMRSFVEGRKNDRIGFLIFSGEAFTLAPPTLDYGLVNQAIDAVEVGKLKDGTAIGDGLALAVSRLKSSTAKSKIIILLTDGDNNVGQVDPATAGDMAAGFGIKVYTVAIGTEGRVKLPIKRKDFTGRERVYYQWFDNALNPDLLKRISEQTFGNFYRVTDADALTKVFSEIDQLEKSKVDSSKETEYSDKYRGFLLASLLILLLEQFSVFAIWRPAL